MAKKEHNLVVGCTVKLTHSVSINHFNAASMATTGVVTRILTSFKDCESAVDKINYIKDREIYVKFPDRAGNWAYTRDEVRRI